MSWADSERYDPLRAGSLDGTGAAPHDRAIVRATEWLRVQRRERQRSRRRRRRRDNKDGEAEAGTAAERRAHSNDPLRTLFVGRLDYKTTEEEVSSLFAQHYGPVRRIVIPQRTSAEEPPSSVGYAFVEFVHSSDFIAAYRDNARRFHGTIGGRQVLIDFQRGDGAQKGWVPRRCGGGLGGKRESGQMRFGSREKPFRLPIVDSEKGESLQQMLPRTAQICRHDSRRDATFPDPPLVRIRTRRPSQPPSRKLRRTDAVSTVSSHRNTADTASPDP